jgi:hypothetical protein
MRHHRPDAIGQINKTFLRHPVVDDVCEARLPLLGKAPAAARSSFPGADIESRSCRRSAPQDHGARGEHHLTTAQIKRESH